MTDGDSRDHSPSTSPPPRFRPAATASRGVSRQLGAVISWPRLRPFGRPRRTELSDALDGLRHRFRRRVPVRIQGETSDCGPACLAMVLAHHGIDTDLAQLRREMNAGRDGVSARTLVETARRHGLSGRGVRATLGGLGNLAAGSVLFWNFGHFLVLERMSARYVYVVDPAMGRRKIPLALAAESFTGVALEFTAPLAPAHRTRLVSRQRLAAGGWRYLPFFFPRGRRAWTALTVTSLLLLPFTLILPVATGWVAGHVASGHPVRGLTYLIPGAAALVVAFLLLQVIRAFAMLLMQALSDKQVTLGVLEHLLSLPQTFFAQRNAGELALRVRTSTTVRQILSSGAMSTVFDGVLILIYMTLLMLASVQLALVVIVLALAQVAVLVIAWQRQQSLMADALESQSRAQGELVELLEGLATLKAAGLDRAAGERWSHSLADEINASVRSRRNLAAWTGISTGLQFAAPLIVLLTGALLVSEGRLALGEALGFAALAMGLFVPLASLVQTGLQVSGLGATLARMSDILQATPENAAPGLHVVHEVAGQVDLHDVCFTYPGTIAPALREITVNIRPGEFVAVLGASGSGKSTLAALIAALYLPDSGEVLIDGQATSTLDRESLRAAVSFVNQDTRLFAGSIQDNIAWGMPVTDIGRVQEAAALAGIHDDIAALPMGYGTLLASGGGGLSGGQRQRIALARALMRRPRLLILDEATSAIDPALEKRIFAGLLDLGCTLVVVAHRLTALDQAGQVLIVEAGRITQRGRPGDLAAAPGPYLRLAGQAGVLPG